MKKMAVWSFSMLILCALVGVSRADDLSTPKGAAMVFAKALETGDAAGAKAAAITDEKGDAFIDGITDLLKGNKKLKEAAIAKYGDAGKDLAGGDETDISKDLADAEVKEDGDSATIITKKDPSKPLNLKKVNGSWKVDIASLMAGEDAEKVMPMFKAMSTAFTELAAEITADKHATPDAAKQALGMKMMAAIAGSGGMGAAVDPAATAPSTQPSDK